MAQYYYENLMKSYRIDDIEKFRSDLKDYLISDVLDNEDIEKLISMEPGVVLEIMEDLSPEVIKTLRGTSTSEEFKDRFENLFRKNPSIAKSIAKKFLEIAKNSVIGDDD